MMEKQLPHPVSMCCLDDNDICMGCFRSIQEILDWGEAGLQGRLEILRAVEERKLEMERIDR